MTTILERVTAPTTAAKTVVDNAKYAWDNSYAEELAALPADFVRDYRDALDKAAVDAIVPHLIAAWRRRGYSVTFGPFELLESGESRLVSNETYWAVWNEAADRLDPHELVATAELNDELNGYREND